jgi:exonuclease-1
LAKGNELLKAANRSKAMEYFQQCIDITPEMALEFIKALRLHNVKYVVAPYEADAQLAFLEQQGIVDGIITEDTDLLVFGCKRCFYKLDKNGSAVLIRLTDRLTSVTDLNMRDWTLREFRRMCILSGCDYLPNIPGIGLRTAHKLLKRCKTIERVCF